MRCFGPTTLLSVALWASVIWCLVAARTIIGCNHLHSCAHDLGFYLLWIDLAFLSATLWFDNLAEA